MHIRGATLALLLAVAPALSAQGTTVTDQVQGRSNEREQYHDRARRETSTLVALYQAFWNAGSARDLAVMYADDAVIYAGSAAPVRGRRAVREHLEARVRSIGAAELVIKEFGASGDLAYLVVATTGAVQDEAQVRPVEGTTVLVLRRNWREEWQIESEVGASGPAPAAPAPRPGG